MKAAAARRAGDATSGVASDQSPSASSTAAKAMYGWISQAGSVPASTVPTPKGTKTPTG